MKDEEIASLIKYRLEQAQIALDDAKFLLDGKRSPQSVVKGTFKEFSQGIRTAAGIGL